MCKLYPMAPRDPVERYFRARVPETNNARSETAASRPTYRAAWAAGQRCLIPAAWYQEPNWETGRNVWRRMTRADGEPWAIAGLWSAPLLAPAVLERIAPQLKRALLVSVGRGGIRQTLVEAGKLRFSRLAPQAGASASDLALACEAESAKIHQYLIGQRIIPRGGVLPVLVLVPPEHLQAVGQHLRSTDELEFVATDLAQAARAIGLRDAPADSGAAALFAHTLLRDPPRAQFAPAEDLRFHRLGRAQMALLALGAAAMIGCLAVAARQTLEAMTVRNQTELTVFQTQSDLARYQGLLAALPPLPARAEALRGVIGRYRTLEASSASPLALYRDISRGPVSYTHLTLPTKELG